MKLENRIILLLLAIGLIAGCGSDDPSPDTTVKAVTKTNPMKLYMHYMPWFQSKSFSGYWGSHWRMTNKNPDIVDDTGKRQIASHYYPLIGPYDSQDPDVIEYHLLLMKYAGIDGVLIDWYGSHAIYDYKVNLQGSNALIDKTDDIGLQFAVVYEDYTAQSVEDQTSKTGMEAGQADMAYLQENYFSKPEYILINKVPLLMTFGPRYFKQASQWTQLFESLKTKPKLLPLWWHAGYTGNNTGGEYAWVDFKEGFADLTSFYNRTGVDVMMGSAFPRFHDFYEEGGTGTSYGYVGYNNGETLKTTLNKAKDKNLQYLQLVTWNDFGEGTVIEPTLEDGFDCLKMIQQFAGVSYGQDELELIYTYYQKKVKYKGDATAMETLKKVFDHLAALEPDQAKDILSQLP
ncbi:MAG TPA: glycoside hydrolase family 71/99-like protein [Ohtaekwangia sp.]